VLACSSGFTAPKIELVGWLRYLSPSLHFPFLVNSASMVDEALGEGVKENEMR
jgi:hypothetical protein